MDTIITSKPCTQCGKVKPLNDFSPLGRQALAKAPPNSKQMGRRSACKVCRAKDARIYEKSVYYEKRVRPPYKHNPQKSRQKSIKKNYGITIEEYQCILDRQNGLCASCGNPETAKGNTGKLKPLAVDHNHVTGKVRALLCGNCNQALGCLKEDPEQVKALLRYINEYVL
jgi:Recombination endonuclease VII